MYYLIRHETRYEYAAPIHDNVMELRLHPRSDGAQRCLSFQLKIDPSPRVFSYRDSLGNIVEHFDIAGVHKALTIYTESLVETMRTEAPNPDDASAGWDELAEQVASGDFTEMLWPSRFARWTEALAGFCAEHELEPRPGESPFAFTQRATEVIYTQLTYKPKATRVDSKIDEALAQRSGVCQDFTHILIAILRQNRIPARYVSGYLFHRETGQASLAADATHAWVEALLPRVGWLGFDPTANLICSDRHIRTAIGRDYVDVPPTKGVYKGGGASELFVSVSVELWGSGISTGRRMQPVLVDSAPAAPDDDDRNAWRIQQQQQQQQQQ